MSRLILPRSVSGQPPVQRATVPEGDVRWPPGGWLSRGHAPMAGMVAWSGPKGLTALATIDETEAFGPLLHVSFSYPNRLPGWEEIKAIRAAFYPADVDVMMVLSAEEDYVDVHPYTLHLFQTPERWALR